VATRGPVPNGRQRRVWQSASARWLWRTHGRSIASLARPKQRVGSRQSARICQTLAGKHDVWENNSAGQGALGDCLRSHGPRRSGSHHFAQSGVEPVAWARGPGHVMPRCGSRSELRLRHRGCFPAFGAPRPGGEWSSPFSSFRAYQVRLVQATEPGYQIESIDCAITLSMSKAQSMHAARGCRCQPAT
jgi:hypothetical protein